ncbi:hypothetical protein SAMD00019534_033570 [Acytostelium subglobosum LB1]|uniref:hypothetical protein n=1 Tax=Acytostelium subglobosum LB1 TaxID=1410327 RepID=UPI000644807F|nr:hypothetical protein SAMD00019534_033570 [Acytostelium subglobosum LB1]GAM20182.1 hypothetical protein SAMD00019534_033570 [Acytostelium subglobosum LB1]|eukprot:XP_012759703.1 hypothetical protein SAMD00019534_033570 [Acytostelium subglobosum LB1]
MGFLIFLLTTPEPKSIQSLEESLLAAKAITPRPSNILVHPALPPGNYLLYGCFKHTVFNFGKLPYTVTPVTEEDFDAIILKSSLESINSRAVYPPIAGDEYFFFGNSPFALEKRSLKGITSYAKLVTVGREELLYRVRQDQPLFLASNDINEAQGGFKFNRNALVLVDRSKPIRDGSGKLLIRPGEVFTVMAHPDVLPEEDDYAWPPDPEMHEDETRKLVQKFGHGILHDDFDEIDYIISYFDLYEPDEDHYDDNVRAMMKHFGGQYPFNFQRDEEFNMDRCWRVGIIDPAEFGVGTIMSIYKYTQRNKGYAREFWYMMDRSLLFIELSGSTYYHVVKWLCFDDSRGDDNRVQFVRNVLQTYPDIMKIAQPFSYPISGMSTVFSSTNMYPANFNDFRLTLPHFAAANDNDEMFKVLYKPNVETDAVFPTTCDVILQLSRRALCFDALLELDENYLVRNPSVHPLWSLAHNRRHTDLVPFKHRKYPGFKIGIPHLPDLEDSCAVHGKMDLLRYLTTNNIPVQERTPHSPEYPDICSPLGLLIDKGINDQGTLIEFRARGLYTATAKIHVCDSILIRCINKNSAPILKEVLNMRFANSSWPLYLHDTKIPFVSFALWCPNIDLLLSQPNMPTLDKLVFNFQQWLSYANKLFDKRFSAAYFPFLATIQQANLLDIFMIFGKLDQIMQMLTKYSIYATDQTRMLIRERSEDERKKITKLLSDLSLLLGKDKPSGGGTAASGGKSKNSKKRAAKKKKAQLLQQQDSASKIPVSATEQDADMSDGDDVVDGNDEGVVEAVVPVEDNAQILNNNTVDVQKEMASLNVDTNTAEPISAEPTQLQSTHQQDTPPTTTPTTTTTTTTTTATPTSTTTTAATTPTPTPSPTPTQSKLAPQSKNQKKKQPAQQQKASPKPAPQQVPVIPSTPITAVAPTPTPPTTPTTPVVEPTPAPAKPTPVAVEQDVYDRTVGKFKFSKKLIIGRGSNGTLVYKGVWCDKVPVAIKEMRKGFNTLIEKEVDILIQLTAMSNSDNLVRFFGKEETEDYIYLATSLCEMSLQELVEAHKTRFQSLTKRSLINDIVSGVQFLHSNRIIHNDLNPRNILFKDNHLFITDMGLSRMSVETSFAFTHMPSGQGGYFPAEVITDQRKTNSVDIFSLGCLIHFILTEGGHPFGDNIHRRVSKIIDNQFDLHQLMDDYATDLITQMIAHDSTMRPSIESVVHHPFFWDINKKIMFIIRVFQTIQNQPHSYLSNDTTKIVVEHWNKTVDSRLLDQLESQYNYNSTKDLIRCIRNTTQHHHQLFKDAQKKTLFFDSQQSAFQYFEQRHPTLIVQLYRRFINTDDAQSDNLKDYFVVSTSS